jgi:hypothetical protein
MALISGVVVHRLHPEMWKDPPPLDIVQRYQNLHRRSNLPGGSILIGADQLVPVWAEGIGTTWNAAVFSQLASDFHQAIHSRIWDKVIPALAGVRKHSHPIHLLGMIHDRFYRFRKQYLNQRPIEIADEVERVRAIQARAEAITVKELENQKRNRRDSRKSTVCTPPQNILPFVNRACPTACKR